ncbi:selenocysteine lyase/cysteine desulfurase [Flavobacteriaceae bacterium MAR_2009_75]|nr:selenocysteine lyase/cysteine desulfurase [Flavobacteriaceae bacterium MAR_2009_75]
MQKRTFIKRLGQLALASPFTPHLSYSQSRLTINGKQPCVETDDFWLKIRADYDIKPDYINLESGYYNIIPIPTRQKLEEHIKMVNFEGAYYMRTVQWDNKKAAAARLAKLVNCSPEELIITRNATESLDMVITGYPWQEDDEAIMAEQDYSSMLDQFKLAARRYHIVNKVVSVPNHPESDEEIVQLYENQITPKTKLLFISHMINITGHILPIKKICEMAHRYGVEVLVDGAHCIGHFDVNIEELDCDYYGTSLHKWLATPLGAGFLYVSKKKIRKIWPLLADHHREPNDIARLNHTGTHPVYTDLTINDAIDYHEEIGVERKENRLRFLQHYWTDTVRNISGVIVNTPIDKTRSCGIANVGMAHLEPQELADTLLNEFKIFTVAIHGANVHGCRVSPNVFTTTEELDEFIKALKTIAARA